MKRYSDEFKIRAVNLYNKGCITYEDIGVSRSSLSIWIGQAKADDLEKTSEIKLEELMRLRKENTILAEEREILKKQLPSLLWNLRQEGSL